MIRLKVFGWFCFVLFMVTACADDATKRTKADIIFSDEKITDTSYVEQRLNTGLDPNFVDHTTVFDSLLTYAVRRDAVNTVRLLLSRGADVDIRSQMLDKTPLFQAAYQNRLRIAKILLENSADANATDDSGNNALREAALAGHTEMVKLLLEAGTDPSQTNVSGDTMIDLAVECNSPEIVSLMREYD